MSPFFRHERIVQESRGLLFSIWLFKLEKIVVSKKQRKLLQNSLILVRFGYSHETSIFFFAMHPYFFERNSKLFEKALFGDENLLIVRKTFFVFQSCFLVSNIV